MSSFTAIIAVFLGGGIGAVLRFGTTQGMLAAGIAQSKLHWATFVINIMASVALVYVYKFCLLYTSPSPRDLSTSRMPSSA